MQLLKIHDHMDYFYAFFYQNILSIGISND